MCLTKPWIAYADLITGWCYLAIPAITLATAFVVYVNWRPGIFTRLVATVQSFWLVWVLLLAAFVLLCGIHHIMRGHGLHGEMMAYVMWAMASVSFLAALADLALLIAVCVAVRRG